MNFFAIFTVGLTPENICSPACARRPGGLHPRTTSLANIFDRKNFPSHGKPSGNFRDDDTAKSVIRMNLVSTSPAPPPTSIQHWDIVKYTASQVLHMKNQTILGGGNRGIKIRHTHLYRFTSVAASSSRLLLTNTFRGFVVSIKCLRRPRYVD